MFGWQPWKPISIDELMTPAVQWVNPDATLQEIAALMRDQGVGAVPVAELGKLIGMVTDRDITVRAVAEGAHPSTVTARDVMTPNPVYCFVDQPVADAAWMMREKRVRRLPVFTRENRMMGILALSDIARDFPILSGRVLEVVRNNGKIEAAKAREGQADGEAGAQQKRRRRIFGRIGSRRVA